MYQIFHNELMLICLKLFQKVEEQEHFRTHFTRLILPWDWNHRTMPHIRQLKANIIDEHQYKSPQQNISKLNARVHEKDYILWSKGISPKDARTVQHPQINQCDTSY